MVALPSWNESRMLATLRHYPRTVKLLLSATLMLTLAKAITFPYLVIYLTRHFALDITQVGLVIGSSLIVGSLLSVYGGFLVDRISSYRLLLGLSALFVVGFIGTVLAQNIWAFYGCLILINLAYAVIDIAIKAGFDRNIDDRVSQVDQDQAAIERPDILREHRADKAHHKQRAQAQQQPIAADAIDEKPAIHAEQRSNDQRTADHQADLGDIQGKVTGEVDNQVRKGDRLGQRQHQRGGQQQLHRAGVVS